MFLFGTKSSILVGFLGVGAGRYSEIYLEFQDFLYIREHYYKYVDRDISFGFAVYDH